jgi:hypothetical protein
MSEAQMAGVLRNAVRLLEAGWGPGTATFEMVAAQLQAISEGFDNGTFRVASAPSKASPSI